MISRMSENSEPGSEAAARDSGSGSVGNLELFFDLVFVYAMAQLTRLVRDDVSWRSHLSPATRPNRRAHTQL